MSSEFTPRKGTADESEYIGLRSAEGVKTLKITQHHSVKKNAKRAKKPESSKINHLKTQIFGARP